MLSRDCSCWRAIRCSCLEVCIDDIVVCLVGQVECSMFSTATKILGPLFVTSAGYLASTANYTLV